MGLLPKPIVGFGSGLLFWGGAGLGERMPRSLTSNMLVRVGKLVGAGTCS